MIFDGDRDRIEPYLRELADLMGLRDWEVFVSDTPPSDPSHEATCAPYYGRKRADIAFEAAWPKWTKEDFRSTCVHELLHCHLHPMGESVINTKSLLGEPAYNLTYITFKDSLEYAVDGIAVAWARTLPLPVEAKTRKKVTQ